MSTNSNTLTRRCSALLKPNLHTFTAGTRETANIRFVIVTELGQTPTTAQSLHNNSTNILVSQTRHDLNDIKMPVHVCTRHRVASVGPRTEVFIKTEMKFTVRRQRAIQPALITPNQIKIKDKDAKVSKSVVSLLSSHYNCNLHHCLGLQFRNRRTDLDTADRGGSIASTQYFR